MFEEVERVKERRRERMEKLRTQTRDSFPPFYQEIHDPIETPYHMVGKLPDRYTPDQQRPPTLRPGQVFGVQVFFSFLLIGFAYLLFHSSLPIPASWRETGQEVMSRDFNFDAVAAWYENRFGQIPTGLPVLTPHKPSVPASTSTQPQSWKFPKDYKVVKAYNPNSARIVINVGETGQVLNEEKGIVTYVGDKSGYNQTVIVQLAGGREVWYGNLETSHVQLNDYLKVGDLIGIAKSFSPTDRYLYLGLKKEDSFIDPTGVISFD
ncbi:peptidoglycan DD-metalloendopeptidase family protein [Brevibacillus ginsengisoli]|uniref:peptidoglycan DD-metalloendopeptidase family protein n=1 Tax=Brevibacillus ginsengisoli TaxID=363854 RepID=UPI003CE8537F